MGSAIKVGAAIKVRSAIKIRLAMEWLYPVCHSLY